MTRFHEQHEEMYDLEREDDGGISLREVASAIHRRRGAIGRILAAVVLLYAIAALAILLLSPSRKLTTLPFRLEFRGADRGENLGAEKRGQTFVLRSLTSARSIESSSK